jgi:hypothetical protein
MIKSWSYSSLSLYEKCAYAAKLKHIDKAPEGENKWATRGTELHEAAEQFVKAETPLLAEGLTSFAPEFAKLRELYMGATVSVEGEWAHTNKWEPTSWRGEDAWVRLKLDYFVQLDKYTGLVVDVKSGRKFGNEIKHAEQGQLYTGAVALRYPDIKQIITEFWYIDQNDITQVKYTREHAVKFITNFDKRARKMTTDTQFKANPSIFTCKWCPYRPETAGGTGRCEFGVDVTKQRR